MNNNIRPTASVIIVNFNGRDLLDECLGSLQRQTFNNFEIIVVDNASSDGSVEFIRDRYPEVRVVQNAVNLGYGGGNNRGIEVAKGKYIVLLNNDTETDPRWLGALVAAAESDEKTGMCASKIMNYYDRDVFDNTGLLLYRDGIGRGRGRLERDRGQYAESDEVFFPSGCAGLYRKAMLDEIGLFDEVLFLYLDDVDIGLRARLAGWKCFYAPEAVVFHKYSATTSPYSPLKAFLLERNRIWIVFRYFPIPMIVASFWYALLRYCVQAYGVVRGSGAGGRFVEQHSFFAVISVILKAYFHGMKGIGRAVRKRREMKTIRKVSDQEIYRWFRDFGIGVREVALKD